MFAWRHPVSTRGREAVMTYSPRKEEKEVVSITTPILRPILPPLVSLRTIEYVLP